jgi:hypothetical protein
LGHLFEIKINRKEGGSPMATPDTAFVRQYKDTITILAQQMDSRLSSTVMVDNDFQGEKKFYEQYASDDLVEIMSQYADTPIQLPDHRRRMITPRYFVGNTLEDPKDALQMLIDPKSTYMQAKQAAVNRKKDDIIIAAFAGTAYTGKDGTTSQSFDSNNQIAVTIGGGGSDVGMNKTKLLNAKRLLDAGEVEKESRYAVHTARQLEDLLNTTEVASADFNTVRALVQGEINTWIGFEWKHTERLLTDGSSDRLCYCYQMKAIQLAIQKDAEGRVDQRPDKNYAWQVYMRICLGATRLEEARIVQIACDES